MHVILQNTKNPEDLNFIFVLMIISLCNEILPVDFLMQNFGISSLVYYYALFFRFLSSPILMFTVWFVLLCYQSVGRLSM